MFSHFLQFFVSHLSNKNSSAKKFRRKSTSRYRLLMESLEPRRLLSATTYWVDDDFSGTGTEGSPFGTISQAAEVAIAGDTINIREGVYRETVTPTHEGTAQNAILYKSYNGEDVVVNGANEITGTGGWQHRSGDNENIFYLDGVSDIRGTGHEQVFIDGKMLSTASQSGGHRSLFTTILNCVRRFARSSDRRRDFME